MEINITPNNIHITDSYLVPKKEILGYCINLHHYAQDMNYPVGNRTPESLASEWYAHNLLYKFGIQRERTKDVDLDYPQKAYQGIAYTILGWAAQIFTR